MRKLIILLSCVIILVSSALMVSAEGYGDSASEIRYNVMPFDTISFGSGSTYPFPANAIPMNTNQGSFNFDYGLFSGHTSIEYYPDVGQVVGHTTFICPDDQFVLRLSNCLIPRPVFLGPIATLTSLDFDDFAISDIHVSCKYFSLVGRESNGEFVVGTDFAIIDYTDTGDTNVKSLGSLLEDALDEKGYDNPDGIYVDELVITVNLNRYTVNTPVLKFSSIYQWIKPQFSFYVLSEGVGFDIPETDVPVGEADLSDFLINTVEGFLGWEIVPGISFSNILYIFVIVALLLWFLTLLI